VALTVALQRYFKASSEGVVPWTEAFEKIWGFSEAKNGADQDTQATPKWLQMVIFIEKFNEIYDKNIKIFG